MTLLVTGGAGSIGSNFVLDWFSAAESSVEPVVTFDARTYAGNPENHVDRSIHDPAVSIRAMAKRIFTCES